jgi:hypothetical protein
MVLSTPLAITCLSVWLLLLPAHCPLALSLSSQAPSTIEEVDGMMYVTEPVNTFRMDRHIQLWAADLHGQRDTEKLDLLLASKTISEMSLLMSYLKAQAAQGTSTTLPWMATDSSPALPTTLDSDNQLQWYKRNILGDVLHALTGVATDEELAKQRQLDEDIRNKVTSTLTRQMAYEKTITDIIGNITNEEEVLGSHLSELAKRHNEDIGKLTRLNVHHQVILEDIDKLEDVISAVWTGEATVRHAVFLSSKANLPTVAHFLTVGLYMDRNGPVVRFSTRLFKTVDVLAVNQSKAVTTLSTLGRTYYLHPGHNLRLPLTELEVRGTRIPCSTCAVQVHMDHQRYLTVSPGRLSCTHASTVLPLNLSMGQQVDLHPEDNCVNEAVHIGRQMLRLQDFEIDTTGDKAVDTLLTAKIGQKDTQVETMVAMKDAHRLLNMKLRQDVTMAQEDISTFVEDTSLALDSVTLSTGFSLGGVAVVTIIVLIIVLCIVCRCRAARAASRAAADTELV